MNETKTSLFGTVKGFVKRHKVKILVIGSVLVIGGIAYAVTKYGVDGEPILEVITEGGNDTLEALSKTGEVIATLTT